ncbi:MAG: phosphonate metabolism protein/1,5-bisphosphokinase (PRPP-forming) PhnN [Candidatus Hodarchaeota archaeon]
MSKTFPGTLFLVVGNSGSGKDSIINGALNKYPSYLKKIYVPKRYITREPSETEENIMISPSKFKELSSKGAFALEWYIYRLYYGIPIEIDEWLKKGHPVVINVSRTVIKIAREIYHNIKVIFIQVPFEITLKRIKEREREGEDRLKERIERAKRNQTFPDADFIVDNSGKLENAIDQFLNCIIKVLESKNK